MATKTKAPKNQKATVTLNLTVPSGTSKTKIEKALSTLLKSGATPEGFKLGAPKATIEGSEQQTS